MAGPLLKHQYPQAIADLLGIPPMEGTGGPWMSTEGTVLSDWVHAVSEALDVTYAGKVPTMAAMVAAVGQTWDPATMSSQQTSSGGGGNISLPAFKALMVGLETHAASGRRRQLNQLTAPFPPPEPGQSQDSTELGAIRIRRGQPRFRADLLRAYGGRCAFTGTDARASLEAAHIAPYGEGGTYEVTNGLLLRADIHTLFDLYLVAVAVSNWEILLHPELEGTTYAEELGAQRMNLPTDAADWPDTAALNAHRDRTGL